MIKSKTKNLIITACFGMLLFSPMRIINAQQMLPGGGNSFETAVKIEPGNYRGGSLDNKEAEYFYIADIKLGQEIDIKGTFSAANVDIGAWAILALYDKDGVELTVEDEGFYDEPLSLTISQIHRGKDSDKYYIMVKCDTWKISSYTLEISLTGKGDEEAPFAGEAVDVEKSKEGSNWALILGIIAIIVIIGIVVIFFRKRKNNSF